MPNNVWKCEVVDQFGDKREYTCRGPESEWEMRRELARGFLDPQRRRAWETGIPFPQGDPFPELVTHPEKYIVSVKAAGTDQTTQLGDWVPYHAKMFDINRYAKTDEQGQPVFPDASIVPPAEAEKGVDMTPRPKRHA